MRILTSDIIRNESRGIGSFSLERGQTALVIRNQSCYKNVFAEKRDQITASFSEFPSFSLEGDLPLVEIDYPTISRVQGVLYRPKEDSGEKELFYLNLGQFSPQYRAGKRSISIKEESIFDQRIRTHQKIRLTEEEDILSFPLDKLRRYILMVVKD